MYSFWWLVQEPLSHCLNPVCYRAPWNGCIHQRSPWRLPMRSLGTRISSWISSHLTHEISDNYANVSWPYDASMATWALNSAEKFLLLLFMPTNLSFLNLATSSKIGSIIGHTAKILDKCKFCAILTLEKCKKTYPITLEKCNLFAIYACI